MKRPGEGGFRVTSTPPPFAIAPYQGLNGIKFVIFKDQFAVVARLDSKMQGDLDVWPWKREMNLCSALDSCRGRAYKKPRPPLSLSASTYISLDADNVLAGDQRLVHHKVTLVGKHGLGLYHISTRIV